MARMTSIPSHPHASLGRQPGGTRQTNTGSSSTKQAGEPLALPQSVQTPYLHPEQASQMEHCSDTLHRALPRDGGTPAQGPGRHSPAPLCAGQTACARGRGHMAARPAFFAKLWRKAAKGRLLGCKAKPSPYRVLSEMSPGQASAPCVGSRAGTCPQDVNQTHR